MSEYKGFYDHDPEELNFVPFDIETTGFKASEGDFVTVFILYDDDQYHIWVNTDGDSDVDINQMYDAVEEHSGFSNFVIYVVEDESLMLDNVRDYLNTHTGHSTVLTAFNGETYSGDSDFDVPFLRTRSIRAGVPWVLDGFWYTDSYEVFSKNNRFDTTVKDDPTLEGMKKSDLTQFIEDWGYDIHYDKMKKTEVVRAINNHSGVTEQVLASWVESNDIYNVDPSDPSSFNKSELERFIDDQSLDIPYDRLSKGDIIKRIREEGFDNEMLLKWHKETQRSIGTKEINDLDGIHEVMIEDKLGSAEWRDRLPFEVEQFEPFDPFESSGEAVTAYKDGDYDSIILHCFADVARTVNLTRMMAEYVSMSDYKPKIL